MQYNILINAGKWNNQMTTHITCTYYNSSFPVLNREHVQDGEWTSSTERVGHVSVDLKWSSSVVEWVCSSVQRNSTAALANKKPITHQSPDHSMSYSLCTHPLSTHLPVTYCTTWTDAHTTHDTWSPLSNTSTNTHTPISIYSPPHAHSHLYSALRLSSPPTPGHPTTSWHPPVDQCGRPPCTPHWSGTHWRMQSLLQHNMLWVRERNKRQGRESLVEAYQPIFWQALTLPAPLSPPPSSLHSTMGC